MAFMPDAWRIDSEKWRASTFSGFGAAAAGGRWNPAGMHVVYVSQHLSTASIEKLVHLPKPIPPTMKFIKFPIMFSGVAIERPPISTLPANWRAEPVAADSQRFGEAWYRRGATAVLAIPCALIPEEENYVINPAHPDFKRLDIGLPEPFTFDPRLAKLISP
jgi:RES domain-containing protein